MWDIVIVSAGMTNGQCQSCAQRQWEHLLAKEYAGCVEILPILDEVRGTNISRCSLYERCQTVRKRDGRGNWRVVRGGE